MGLLQDWRSCSLFCFVHCILNHLSLLWWNAFLLSCCQANLICSEDYPFPGFLITRCSSFDGEVPDPWLRSPSTENYSKYLGMVTRQLDPRGSFVLHWKQGCHLTFFSRLRREGGANYHCGCPKVEQLQLLNNCLNLATSVYKIKNDYPFPVQLIWCLGSN